MNILLTNDDGYQAPGINYLKDYFTKKNHKVFVVAPDTEKSGSSHSITLRDAIKLVEKKDNLWVLKGTPADCVILATLGLIDEKIDAVVSGINHGPNIGRDTIYSGTAGAARQGSLQEIPSFALSMNSWNHDVNLDAVGDFLDEYFDKLLQNIKEDCFYNINFPNKPKDQIKGVKSVFACPNHYYQSELVHFDSPVQGRYYWVDGNAPNYDIDDDTDACALRNGYIAVSLIKIFSDSLKVKL